MTQESHEPDDALEIMNNNQPKVHSNGNVSRKSYNTKGVLRMTECGSCRCMFSHLWQVHMLTSSNEKGETENLIHMGEV